MPHRLPRRKASKNASFQVLHWYQISLSSNRIASPNHISSYTQGISQSMTPNYYCWLLHWFKSRVSVDIFIWNMEWVSNEENVRTNVRRNVEIYVGLCTIFFPKRYYYRRYIFRYLGRVLEVNFRLTVMMTIIMTIILIFNCVKAIPWIV